MAHEQPHRNEASGHANNVVQFRDIIGDIHFHEASPVFRVAKSVTELTKVQHTPPKWRGKLQPINLDQRVILWGAPGSGKTCYLASLNAAISLLERQWFLTGADVESTDFITMQTATLIGRRTFPEATYFVHEFSWIMASEIEVEMRQHWRRASGRIPIQLHIEVVDPPGGLYAEATPPPTLGLFVEDENGFEGKAIEKDRLLNALATSDCIIYFFDPLRERHYGDSWEYFQSTLALLEHRLHQSGRLIGSRLPLNIAVCITKYDHPEILDFARKGGHLWVDPADSTLTPQVSADRAEDFFDHLCRSSPTGGASLVRHAIKRYFSPERVRYFATSSIGFHLNDSKRFDPADHYNIGAGSDGTLFLRGNITPINIVEPLLWLQGAGGR
ncbi:hypothetical protein [Actinomadura terrae]|uniref:hypothetical protein n=1 Tax=Actinomadura terrae TaxID=604353 RepID=UPI001FA6B9EB|nr:hypothetical protein [Actinomadura terrae]